MRRDGIRERRTSGATSTVNPVTQAIAQLLAFNPASWHRFDSTYVTLNGSSISAAADLTPNARHATQATSTAQPSFANPGATFDGTDDRLTTGSAYLNGVSGVSAFIVADLTGGTLSATTYMHGIDSGANVLNFDFGGATSKPRLVVADGVSFRTAIGPTDRSGATGRFLFDARVVLGASGSGLCWENGVQGASNSGSWGATSVANVAPSFGALPTGGRAFPGTLLDIVLFSTALSLADQASVRTLLARTRGIAL